MTQSDSKLSQGPIHNDFVGSKSKPVGVIKDSESKQVGLSQKE